MIDLISGNTATGECFELQLKDKEEKNDENPFTHHRPLNSTTPKQ